MTKIAFISGMNYPKFTERGDIAFCLAHQVLKDDKYAKYYRKQSISKYVIIDNSAAELGKSINPKDVLRAALMVNAHEIWCPDKLYDMKTTLKWTKDFIALVAKEGYIGDFSLVGLPQGKNLKEWLKCYKIMNDEPFIDVIAISKYSVECFNELAGTKNFAICRKYCINYLHEKGLVDKPLHCAGANNFIIDEIKYYSKFSGVRSIDSNIAFKLGVHKIKIDECIDEPKERLDHEIKNLSNKQKQIINYNIKKVKDAIKWTT